MHQIEKTVFISYRRTNTPWALAIYQSLTAHGYDVFLDYQNLKSGDFEQVILQNIKGRAHFLIVLTPSALERCAEPGDWLRREIEWAIDEKRNIIPLFLEGFNFGTPSIAKYLTGKLSVLKKYNGLSVPAEYFEAAMHKLRDERLNVALDTILHPISPAIQQKVQEQQQTASQIPGVKESTLTAQEWFEKGLNSKVPDDKLYYYNQAIRLQPDFADAYNNRATAREGLGDSSGAKADYAEAIELGMANLHLPYFNRGNLHTRQGDRVAAMKDYEEAIRLKPDFAQAYTGRGAIRRAQGDVAGAIQDYTDSIRLKPDYALAYYNRGNALQSQKNFTRAIADYGEAIRLKNDYFSAYGNRGLARKGAGDIKGAIQDHTEALKINPNHLKSYKNRGIARKELGDVEGAIKDYQKYLDLGGGIRHRDQEAIEREIRALKNQK